MPASEMTIEITSANFGRSMKKAENISGPCVGVPVQRVLGRLDGVDDHVRPNLLNAVDNDLLAGRKSA